MRVSETTRGIAGVIGMIGAMIWCGREIDRQLIPKVVDEIPKAARHNENLPVQALIVENSLPENPAPEEDLAQDENLPQEENPTQDNTSQSSAIATAPVLVAVQTQTNSDPETKTESVEKKKPRNKLDIWAGRIAKVVKPAELKPEEKTALEQVIIPFLDKYGPYDYSCVELFVKGAGNGDNVLEEKIREDLTSGLIELGVEPGTANNANKLDVLPTLSELKKFKEAMKVLKDFSERAVPGGEKMIFPNGYFKRSAEDTFNRKLGEPHKGKLVSTK